MDSRLTKPPFQCKIAVFATALVLGIGAAAQDGGERRLRECIAGALGTGAVAACEKQQQALLKARITRWTDAIGQKLSGPGLALFARNTRHWKAFFDSEVEMLERTLMQRRDGLGAKLFPGAVTRLYEERERQLREHLHNLSHVGQTPRDQP